MASTETKLRFPPRQEGEQVTLQGADVRKPINENLELLVYGEGYGSEAEAAQAGGEWVGIIKRPSPGSTSAPTSGSGRRRASSPSTASSGSKREAEDSPPR